MTLVKKYKWILLGLVLGALGGYGYYYFIGCSSGTCAITSRPLNSTLYGALIGFVLTLNTKTKKNGHKKDYTE